MRKRFCPRCSSRLGAGEYGLCLSCRTGWVYIVEAVGADAVKIGFCAGRRNLRLRLETLQCGNHCELRVLGHRVGTYADEAALQKQLTPWLIRREWFHLTREVRGILTAFTDESVGHAMDTQEAS